MANPWIFEWYDADQDLRPLVWRRAIGKAPVNVDPPVPVSFVLSNPTEGRSVRFRSLLGGSGPPYVPVNQEIPFEPGSRLNFINVNEAQVDLKVLFKYDSQDLLWAQLRTLPYIFNPLRGQGTLKVTNPGLAIRYLDCVCISGFKIDESTLQEKSVEATLSFWANNPYWYSDWTSTTLNYMQITQGALPILPSTLVRSPGDLAAGYAITNNGDVNSKMVVIVSGPYKNPIVQNTSVTLPTPNPQVNLSNNGGLNNTLDNPTTIDFLNKTILISTGVGGVLRIGIQYLTTTSTFWSLKPGLNNLQFQIQRPTVPTGQPQPTLQDTKISFCFRSAYSTMI